MSLVTQLASLALKGAAQAASHASGVAALAVGAERGVDYLTQRFRDNSARLDRALEHALAAAWRSVEVALAGRGWWDRCKLALATGDEKAIRRQVEAFLAAHPLDGVDGHGPDFRGQCLAQLQSARKAGLLDQGHADPAELARRVGDLSRFGDPTSRVEAEFNALAEVATELRRRGYDAVATFLTLRPASGPPLLPAAARYFFQRELEKDPQLFQGLAYAQLDAIAEGQRWGFAGLEEHAVRLESLLAEVQAVVVQTHVNVLDMKAELSRQGAQIQELGDAVLKALAQRQLERRALSSGDSLSIRDERERRLVRDLVKRYRALPADQRHQMPALLNAVGKLEVVSGEFEAAERDFREVARLVPDKAARAEAAHNAYLAALERRAWGDALTSLKESVALDPARFAPYPAEKFEPERVLGAGGFGVALLCRNRHSGGRVVVKALRRDHLDRDLGDVFKEAQALEELEHPAIIRVRDCDYADAARARPYLVMDYFPGQSLGEHVEQHGPLAPNELVAVARLVAEGLRRAHAKGILHRDVKPGNLLVKRLDGAKGWEVKLIDFGLALRADSASSTAKASMDRTLAGSSLAGTLEYAAPEQMGKVKGVAAGPYSDVYGFGKTCCFALFGTASPTFQHWQWLPTPLADLLGRCLAEQPRDRPQDFAAVLRELDGLDKAEGSGVVEKAAPLLAASMSDAGPAEATGRGSWLPLVWVALFAGLITVPVFFLRSRGQKPPPPSSGTAVKKPTPPTAVPTPAVTRQTQGPWISDKEFDSLLAGLKPTSFAELKKVADRLGTTPPTPKQERHHAELRKKEALAKDKAGPSKRDLDAMRKDDAITRVSQVAGWLMWAPDPTAKAAGVKLATLWGTIDNEANLRKIAADKKQPDAVRRDAETALQAIERRGRQSQ